MKSCHGRPKLVSVTVFLLKLLEYLTFFTNSISLGVYAVCLCFIYVIICVLCLTFYMLGTIVIMYAYALYDFLVTVKATPYKCVIRTGLP